MLALYWNTVRHLKPIQVYGRAARLFVRSNVDWRGAPPIRAVLPTAWTRGAERRPSMLETNRFRFLNETIDLPSVGWDDSSRDKLWRYNLHYFDDLNAVDADARTTWHRHLLKQWVRDNPPGVGTAWEPYPTSLRIVNWIKWSLRGNAVSGECIDSLATQVRWLSHRLETHLLGNHLFANAKALVFAGVYFEGDEATRWFHRGLGVLERQIPEQILSDGAQFELSPMYHALALEDMLDLCNLAASFPSAIRSAERPEVARWRALVPLMRSWLTAMCHPDGEIGSFNDAAAGIAPSPDQLDRYAERLGFGTPIAARPPLTHMRASGYVRLEQDPAVAILDVGRIGPDYLPAHAHADTLSFELSLFGQRVFVNSGTSVYGAGAERARQRGTAAHNTVVIDGENSSEVWSGFRVARRARPIGLETAVGERFMVRCGHDGYDRLPGRPRHLREWSLSPGVLAVNDTISGSFRHATARFHLHPSVSVEPADGSVGSGAVDLSIPGGRRIRFSVEGGLIEREHATWHPEFGVSVPTMCLVATFTRPVLQTEVRWDASV